MTWHREISGTERRALGVCFGGWALDAFDSQSLGLVLPALAAGLALTRAQAGSLASVALVSSAIGGWLAGALSDRWGRVRVLQLTIAWFSVFAVAGALAHSYPQLVVAKALQGFGFGGEWAAGAVLMAEIIRPAYRGRALGTVQAAWAVGWGAAVLLYEAAFSFLPPDIAWRAMFAAGGVPIVLAVAVTRLVPEPRRRTSDDGSTNPHRPGALGIFSRGLARTTVAGALLGVGAHGGYYALMTWLPSYLKDERHLSVVGSGDTLAVIVVAFGLGCLVSAQLLDRIGRRGNVALFAGCCVATVLLYLLVPISNRAMLFAGFPLGFFAAGLPASLGALFSELYPAGIRGTGVGFCYNFGRIASAFCPWLVGHLSLGMRLGRAIALTSAAAYGLAVAAVLLLPETRGRVLT
jgi:MFS family permease